MAGWMIKENHMKGLVEGRKGIITFRMSVRIGRFGVTDIAIGIAEKEIDPPIITMARLMDEIEAFEESLKPKQEPAEEDEPITTNQFFSDGWKMTQSGNFYKQGMHACWVDNDRTWRLLVGNDDTLHTSMKSLKARIRELLDQKFQWLL